MTYKKAFSPLRTLMFLIVAGCLFTACQENEFETVAKDADAKMDAATAATSSVESITIMGENTQVVGSVDCKTCTFVLDNKSETIDGAELGVKPGNIICLETGITYGNISFVNLQGTEENPILIANTTRKK